MPVTRILVTNDGKVIVEGINYVGGQCLADLKKLQEVLRLLGVEVKVESQKLKPEVQTTYEVAEQ